MRYLFLFILILPILSCSDNSTKTQVATQPSEAIATQPADTTSINSKKTIIKKPAMDSTFLIVPGESIGQISLGQTAEKINNTLGKADSGDAAMGKAMAFWYGKQHKQNYVAVYFSRNFDGGPENLLARQIRVNSSSFKTAESIAPGSGIASIRQNYTLQPIAYYLNPQQQRIYILDDPAQGIAFEITTPDSICTAITIHQKGENMTNSYLPVHPDLVRLKE